MSKHYCYFNNQLIPEEEACISVYDIGFLRGYGVFDYMRTYNSKPFLLDEHVKRLKSSASEIGINFPLGEDKIKKIVKDLISKNNTCESTIRIVVTGGISPDGMSPGSKPTFLVLTRNLKPVPQKLYTKGIGLLTDDYERDLPKAKHLNYSNLIKQKERLETENVFSLLYTSKDNVLESAICNFFIVKNGKIVTPNQKILQGTTKRLVIALAKEKYEVEERSIPVEEIKDADEAFITGTTQGILPVVNIDHRAVADSTPGVVTMNLLKILDEYVQEFSGGIGLFAVS